MSRYTDINFLPINSFLKPHGPCKLASIYPPPHELHSLCTTIFFLANLNYIFFLCFLYLLEYYEIVPPTVLVLVMLLLCLAGPAV